MAAAAGGLYAVVLLVVTPQSMFGMLVSAQAVVVTLFGGVGVVWGPVIGAAILVPLAETLHAELGTSCPASRASSTASPSSPSSCCRPRALLDHPRPLVRAARRPPAAGVAAIWRAVPPPARRAARAGAARRCSSSTAVARLRRPEGRQRGELLGRRGRDPRHHRAERRGQDHAVQRAERRPAARRRQHPARRQPMLGRRRTRSAAWASAARSRWCAPSRACPCSTT